MDNVVRDSGGRRRSCGSDAGIFIEFRWRVDGLGRDGCSCGEVIVVMVTMV